MMRLTLKPIYKEKVAQYPKPLETKSCPNITLKHTGIETIMLKKAKTKFFTHTIY
jgi:hypothetical protein